MLRGLLLMSHIFGVFLLLQSSRKQMMALLATRLWLYHHSRQLERENEAVVSELQNAKAELEALKD